MTAPNEEKERIQALMWVQRDHSDVVTTCSKEGSSHATLPRSVLIGSDIRHPSAGPVAGVTHL